MDEKIKKLVFENLVAFAFSDGLEESEEDFLYRFAKENDIDKAYAEETIKNCGDFVIP